MERTVQINNLQMPVREMEEILSKYGSLEDVWTSGRIASFVVVTFKSREVAERVVRKMQQKNVNTWEWRVEWHKAKRRECWRAMHDSTRNDDRKRYRSRSRSESRSRKRCISKVECIEKTSAKTASRNPPTSTKTAPTDASSPTKTNCLQETSTSPTDASSSTTTTTTETVTTLVATPRIDLRI